MTLRWVVLVDILLVYAFLCLCRHHRAKAVWAGVAFLVLARLALPGQDPEGHLALGSVLYRAVNWNVMGIFAAAMLIADLFMASGVPVLVADLIADRCRTTRMALVAVCLFSGLVSAFVDNVTTVLLVAPVALAIVKRTHASPVPVLIGVSVSANLQGAATLIGDLPSMLLAGHFKLTFNDFFIHQGRPSLFFAIQIGAVASIFVLFVVFRRHREPMVPIEVERPKTWAPLVFMGVKIAFLAVSSYFDPGFVWLAGAGCIVLALMALGWTARGDPAEARRALLHFDLPTVFFLAGIFALTYAMDRFGWVKTVADGVTQLTGRRVFLAYSVLVWVSVLVSAFVDNIPYMALLLPVTNVLAAQVGGHEFLYGAGLLIGTSLGGNITPIGASCNVVAVGMLRREGHAVSFWEFARIGLPFTVVATLAGYLFIWAFWG